ncbi:MAG: hypothetical protein JST84_09635 [Acidobacteria bacterium]|nr:hypothetical protein [Acidobacteriota bacterium]
MIEITFFVFLILLVIKPLAKERGEGLMKWILLAVGAWLGTAVLFVTVLYLLLRQGMRLQLNLTTILPLVILFYLTTVSATFWFVIRPLRKKPVIPTSLPTTE